MKVIGYIARCMNCDKLIVDTDDFFVKDEITNTFTPLSSGIETTMQRIYCKICFDLKYNDNI